MVGWFYICIFIVGVISIGLLVVSSSVVVRLLVILVVICVIRLVVVGVIISRFVVCDSWIWFILDLWVRLKSLV